VRGPNNRNDHVLVDPGLRGLMRDKDDLRKGGISVYRTVFYYAKIAPL